MNIDKIEYKYNDICFEDQSHYKIFIDIDLSDQFFSGDNFEPYIIVYTELDIVKIINDFNITLPKEVYAFKKILKSMKMKKRLEYVKSLHSINKFML